VRRSVYIYILYIYIYASTHIYIYIYGGGGLAINDDKIVAEEREMVKSHQRE